MIWRWLIPDWALSWPVHIHWIHTPGTNYHAVTAFGGLHGTHVVTRYTDRYLS